MKNNIGLMLEKRARLNPDLEAVYDVEPNRRYSYREANQRANRAAHTLIAQGVRKGDRVGLLLMNGIAFYETFFAIAKLGAVCVPLNWRLVPDELEFILSDAGVSVLVFGEEFEDAVQELSTRPKLNGPDGIRAFLEVRAGSSASSGPAPSASESGKTSCPDWALDYAALCAESADTEPVAIDGDDLACDDDNLYIMYTSGTTGLPKGVVHTHSSALWGCITMLASSEVAYADRYIVALPLFHVGALTPMAGNVQRGSTSIILKAFDPSLVWKIIESERVTNMLAVPAMLNFMAQVPEAKTASRPALRWIMSGAAPVPVALIELYTEMGIPIHQVYGMTETCGPACLTSPEDAVNKVGSTGRPFFHTEVRVVSEAGVDVATGEAGEVWISGPHIMKEYWNRTDATAEALSRGWLKSGDIATIDEDGCIYIQDRKKDMIISGGENVYPAEVENAILSLEGVADAAVIGIPSEKWGESGLAIVVRSDENLTAQAVLDHCRGKLARFKQPVAAEFVDEIPRNPSGKILKRVLRERFPGPAAQ